MDITKIAIIAIVSVILAVVLKDKVPVFAVLISVAVTLVIFFIILPQISDVVSFFEDINRYVNVEPRYIKVLVKSVCISYIAMFTSQLCRDFGQGAIGDKVELAGKVLILILATPLITELIEDVVYIF